ncbi:PQQ-binding-like beta-propeller repeat protein [Halorubrum sp. F4]|uniref:outer membrane protein assembly factor BamB family protein n=1 Tax=Halorubrum sp. F4 TaxID=2989715 RepID=UPI00247FC7CA|nr:PQQ-binding-like beta-propeller repeat protein [Halorubrum sp. F4]
MTGAGGSGASRDRNGAGTATNRYRPARRSVLRGTAGVLSAAGVSTWGLTEGPTTAAATNHVPDRAVYVGSDDGSLYAVDAETGEAVWRFDDPSDAVSSSPTVVDGTVYVGSIDGTLYAVDATDGSSVWSFEIGDGEDGGIVSSPTVVNDRAFVGASSGSIVALDRTGGTEAWRVEESVSAVVSSPAVDGETLYAGTEGGDVLALSTDDGTERWRASAPEDGISSSPTVVDGAVYVGSFDNRVYAFDAVDGEPAWNADLEDIVFSSPTVVDGTVYVGSVGATVGLHALDAGTGDRQWATDGIPGVVSSPTVVDGTVYVGSVDGSLYAVDAETGDVEWAAGASDQVNSSPTVSDGTAFVGDAAGTLYGFDVETAEERWRFDDPGDAIFSSPTVVDLVGEGHGVGSRTTLGTLGHHHSAAGVEFEGGSGSTGSDDSTDPTGSDDSSVDGSGSSDGGADESGAGSIDGSTAGSGSSGWASRVPAVGLLGAAGGLTVGALAAYRFLGGDSDETSSGAGSEAGSPAGRPSTTDAAGSATVTEATGTDESDTGTAGTESAQATVDEGTASSSASPASTNDTSGASTIDSSGASSGSSSAESADSTDSIDSTADPETAQLGEDAPRSDVETADSIGGPDEDALLAAVDELTSIETVGSTGALVAYAVTDERIDGGDGRVLALPDAEPAVADRFESVATDWGSVSHYDGIATVYGSGTEPYPWVLTDPLQGVPTLAAHLDDPPENPADRLSPVVDAAEALSQASRYTVRHYYLSPETVRVVGSGTEPTGIVDDWGIESVTETAEHGTRASSPYTAPEQLPDSDEPLWRGKPDTYALGALAYHAATGSPPADHRPAKPSEHAGVPSELDRPITRAIDPDPDERYDSIGEFARVLRLAVFD